MELRAETFRANGVRNDEDQDRLVRFLCSQYSLTGGELSAIRGYLENRGKEVHGKDTFGVVYDITRYCNLACAHCCVAAILTKKGASDIPWETTTEEACLILDKIARYSHDRGLPRTFVIFGGGEPTMRTDIERIVAHAAQLFGSDGVGINTNGTHCQVDRMLAMEPNLGFIEVSIDGFEKYHNAWRNPGSRAAVANPFQASVAFVEELLRVPTARSKLEVSSAVTTENLDELPAFARFIADLGVESYSIHRAMPVGRMGARLDKIPSGEQYVRLMLTISKLREETNLKSLHLHHSLESIYSLLFLGRDIHRSDLLTGSGRHSIGLDPHGNVYFDPWAVVPPFNQLVAGDLLSPDSTLSDIIEAEDSLIHLADEISTKQLRCRGCKMDCTGGMRFNALGHYVFRTRGKASEVELSDLVAGLSEIDPACPLYTP